MHDQADELRQLVLRTAAASRVPALPPPPMVVVCGGKGGVGTTTIAVNLTVLLARLGRRAVLVDADLNQPDATTLCNVREADTVADVLSGRRTVHEVLQPGPAGIQVLPGAWAPSKLTDCPPLAQQRMLSELQRLGAHADVIVLDVGSDPNPVTGRFWQAAQLVVLVTTSDSSSIMDSYAAIKLLAGGAEPPTPLRLLVNKSTDDASAADVHTRIEQACRRFLNMPIEATTPVPLDPDAAAAADRARRPLVAHDPTSPASQALEALADEINALTSGSAPRSMAARPGAA